MVRGDIFRRAIGLPRRSGGEMTAAARAECLARLREADRLLVAGGQHLAATHLSMAIELLAAAGEGEGAPADA